MWYYNHSTLAHHGVKGMKWGVRRTPEQLGRVVLKPGTSFTRISTNIERMPHSKRTYVTYTESDLDYYKQHMTDFRRSYNPFRPIYQMTYKNVKDIVHPTHEKQVDEFLKLYEDRKFDLSTDMAKEAAARVADSYGEHRRQAAFKKFYDEYSNYTLAELPKTGYKEFIRTYSSLKLADLYQQRLAKQGYNAILDDNDILFNRMDTINPEKSLVVFDPIKNLQVSGAKELTNAEYKAALERNAERRAKNAERSVKK